MSRGRTKDFRRQIDTVQALSVSPREYCEVTELMVEEFAGGNIHLRRVVVPNHAKCMQYVENFLIGPLGAIKKTWGYINY